MKKNTKALNIKFYSLSESKTQTQEISNILKAISNSDSAHRILSIRNRKQLIKLHSTTNNDYLITVVRERNTWQAKAQGNGRISTIHPNQGIIGDIYYFLLSPSINKVLGLTSGPSGTIKSVLKSTLESMLPPSSGKVDIQPILKERSQEHFNLASEFTRLQFKIDTAHLDDIPEEAPQLLKDIGNSSLAESSAQLSLDLRLDNKDPKNDRFPQSVIIELITYLSDYEGCATLKATALDDSGKAKIIDLGDSYLTKSVKIETSQKFINEDLAEKILTGNLNH